MRLNNLGVAAIVADIVVLMVNGTAGAAHISAWFAFGAGLLTAAPYAATGRPYGRTRRTQPDDAGGQGRGKRTG
jgi:hypothetical protein